MFKKVHPNSRINSFLKTACFFIFFLSAYSIYSQAVDCSSFYKGEFQYILGGVELKAIRKNGYQEIFKKVNGQYVKDSVESLLWVDECSFRIKIIQSNSEAPEWQFSVGLLIQIISVQDNTYIYQAYFDKSPYYSGKVTKVRN